MMTRKIGKRKAPALLSLQTPVNPWITSIAYLFHFDSGSDGVIFFAMRGLYMRLKRVGWLRYRWLKFRL
jgi:hypothetical protein